MSEIPADVMALAWKAWNDASMECDEKTIVSYIARAIMSDRAVRPAIGEGSRVPSPHEYAMEYEFRGDGDYTPTDAERTMIEDAICGYLGEVSALRSPSEPEDMGKYLDGCAAADQGSPQDLDELDAAAPPEPVSVVEPVAWHCVGSGDGWAEDKITRDRETAEDYARRPHQWRVTPLYASPPDVELVRKAEAFDQIVAARKRFVEATAAYNARLEFVRDERQRGNWLNVDREYAALSEAQSAYHRTVQELSDRAALSAKESK